MSRLNRRFAWAFAAGTAAAILAIGGLRLVSSPRGMPAAAEAGDVGLVAMTDGRAGLAAKGEASDLAALARRLRTLQDDLNRTRTELRQTQAASADLRDRANVLDDMLARDALTDCPVFLHEETTVRALQGILREATESRGPDGSARPPTPTDRMGTGAMIARQRLRQRLAVLRDEMAQQARDLDARADVLGADLRRQADEVERLEGQLMSRIPAPKGENGGDARSSL